MTAETGDMRPEKSPYVSVYLARGQAEALVAWFDKQAVPANGNVRKAIKRMREACERRRAR